MRIAAVLSACISVIADDWRENAVAVKTRVYRTSVRIITGDEKTRIATGGIGRIDAAEQRIAIIKSAGVSIIAVQRGVQAAGEGVAIVNGAGVTVIAVDN